MLPWPSPISKYDIQQFFVYYCNGGLTSLKVNSGVNLGP
jgi:hypothetical protein